LNDKQNAVKNAEKAIEMDPYDDEILRVRDGIYSEMEEYERADTAFS